MQTQFLTRQTLFDRVTGHLLAQNERSTDMSEAGLNEASLNDDPICRYRSPDGRLKCAIGCLISDADYSPEWEGTGLIGASAKVKALRRATGIAEADIYFASLLMDIHDQTEPDLWPAALEELAEVFGLDKRRLLRARLEQA